MLGGGMILPTTPAALADAMTVLRVIADPKTAQANLEALAKAAGEIEAKMAELVAREAAIIEQKKANDSAADQIEKDRKALNKALAAHAINEKALADQKRGLVAQKTEHAERVAAADDQAKALAETAAQLAQREAKLSQEAAQHRLDTAAAHDALGAREQAVAAGEAELKAKVAEWQRVTKGILQG